MPSNKRKSVAKRARKQRLFPSKAIGFMPDQFRTTLRYCEFLTITCTAGALSRYEFLGNGLYDPNFTGTGHQPLGFDQLIAIYSYAVVHGCKAICTASVASGYEQMYVLLQQGPSVLSAPADFGQAVEKCPTDEWSLVTPFSDAARLRANGTTEEFLGVPLSQQLAESSLYSSSASNPSLIWYVRVYTQPTDGASTSYLRVLVELEFDVTFVKPVTAAAS